MSSKSRYPKTPISSQPHFSNFGPEDRAQNNFLNLGCEPLGLSQVPRSRQLQPHKARSPSVAAKLKQSSYQRNQQHLLTKTFKSFQKMNELRNSERLRDHVRMHCKYRPLITEVPVGPAEESQAFPRQQDWLPSAPQTTSNALDSTSHLLSSFAARAHASMPSSTSSRNHAAGPPVPRTANASATDHYSLPQMPPHPGARSGDHVAIRDLVARRSSMR